METLETILTRRSIRRYTPQKVSDLDVQNLLRAAMAAPSAGNQQSWRFGVIRDRALLNQIADFHGYANMLREASVAILVCGDQSLERFSGFWVQDCAAATQNILLAAHALQLGAVWVGLYPVEERLIAMRQLLKMPEHVIPFSVVSVGYADEVKAPADRFDASRVRYNRWG